MNSKCVEVLPIVEKLTLLNEDRCRALLQIVSRRFPEVVMDVVDAVTPEGKQKPVASLLTAARIATVILGRVGFLLME